MIKNGVVLFESSDPKSKRFLCLLDSEDGLIKLLIQEKGVWMCCNSTPKLYRDNIYLGFNLGEGIHELIAKAIQNEAGDIEFHVGGKPVDIQTTAHIGRMVAALNNAELKNTLQNESYESYLKSIARSVTEAKFIDSASNQYATINVYLTNWKSCLVLEWKPKNSQEIMYIEARPKKDPQAKGDLEITVRDVSWPPAKIGYAEVLPDTIKFTMNDGVSSFTCNIDSPQSHAKIVQVLGLTRRTAVNKTMLRLAHKSPLSKMAMTTAAAPAKPPMQSTTLVSAPHERIAVDKASSSYSDDDEENFSEEDLARLRGELPFMDTSERRGNGSSSKHYPHYPRMRG